jgi:carbamoyl-phosphate synthase small subunit
MSLSEYLKSQKIVGISEIDTRALTQYLRINGSQSGCIMAGTIDEKEAVKKAQSFIGIAGMDLASVVSTQKKYIAKDGEWLLGEGYQKLPKPKYHVVAYDFGIKRNILRMLNSRNCKITVVPAKFSAKDLLALKPDGVFLSNGPGDPEPCDYALDNIKVILEKKLPIFGICLGHQLLALASGAKTLKMKFGHHGANHPVQDKKTGKVFITSQNHGFTVDTKSLPTNLEITHVSLFDKTLQGISRTDAPAFSFQGHPEASPGPSEMDYLFDQFINMMKGNK